MKSGLHNLIRGTFEECIRLGLLKDMPLPAYVIEIPNHPDHGHFATNLPLALASGQKRPPLEIASVIVDHLVDKAHLVERAEAAAPGFINFRIRREIWYGVLESVLRLGERYGGGEASPREPVLVEFVSANPTGPLHLGHGRGAAFGDTLCRILAFCGYQVTREFYVNDAGRQIRLLGESIYSRYKQQEEADYPFPENGYHGGYVRELAERISTEADLDGIPAEEAVALCSRKGKVLMLEAIKEDLARFGVSFDVWFSELGLHRQGLLEQALEIIRQREQVYEKDGAVWIKTSAHGDDKDRVVRKSDQQYTYFASDIAYHLEKHKRGFRRAINIWGADHHGYVPRVNAALSACGLPEGWLSVILMQLVKLWQGGQEIRMSKRTGDFVTLQELVDEVGVDAVRFIFLTKSHDSTLDFDIDLAKKQDSDNPVYYVQYAHARICSVFRKAHAEGITLPEPRDGLLERLVMEEEMALIRSLAEFPSLLEDICRSLEPHRLTYFLTDLASSFHKYFNLGNSYPEHRIVGPDQALSQARLCLAEGVRRVIANGLRLMGIVAPERM
jgi:arginyl-tRNA synthetase